MTTFAHNHVPHACSIILHITERSCSSMFYGHVKLTSVSIANEAVWCVVRTETLSPPVACTHILTLNNIPCGPLCLPSPYQCILQGSAKGERWPKTFTNHRTNTINAVRYCVIYAVHFAGVVEWRDGERGKVVLVPTGPLCGTTQQRNCHHVP